MRGFQIVACLALLSACSNDMGQSPNTDGPSEPSTLIEQGGEEKVNREPAPEASAGASPQTADTSIPDQYHGVWVWDYVQVSCETANEERIEIKSDKIVFYESVGTVTAIEQHSEGLIVSLEMQGEGEIWTRQEMLRLVKQDSNDVTLYLLPTPDEDILVTPIPWTRCTQ